MNNTEFVDKLKYIAKLDTIYVNGCFGAPMTEANKKRYMNNTAYNRQPDRSYRIASSMPTTYGFDCCGLIKSVLWGFKADGTMYGGAIYCSNGVPDLGEDAIIQRCKTSTNFNLLDIPGAVVYIPGHIGVYIGNGLVVESSPKWFDGVQITACLNKGSISGYNGRKWSKWGLLPYITYEDTEMVKKINVLCNGKKIEVDAIEKEGTNYIRLRDFDDKLGIVKVSYDSALKLPVIKSEA